MITTSELINTQRLVDEFTTLVKIDSLSLKEKPVADYLEKKLKELGATTLDYDNAYEKIGGTVGNLYSTFAGKEGEKTVLLSAHMDTVAPGEGIKPIIDGDLIKTDGTTILGGDDKSGIAIILETILTMKEKNIPHRPIQVVFTISEEQGLKGSKNMDASKLKADFGFCLDDHVPGHFTVGAPAKCSLDISVHGEDAHAGVEPHKGINAIKVAADCIMNCKIGPIDEETVANIGIIHGGTAINRVPPLVEVKGEARSRNNSKLEAQLKHMKDAFEKTAEKYVIEVDGKKIQAKADVKINYDYQAFNVSPDHESIQLAKKACEKLGIDFATREELGGIDANNFNRFGVPTCGFGTGMNNVHKTTEFITISEMVKSAELLLEILRV